jgi:hypothetical protein
MSVPDNRVDVDSYPTEEFLKWIETYDTVNNDPLEFIRVILDEWYHGDFGWRIQRKYKGERKVFISTCGWSGNEEMMNALQSNTLFWIRHYYSHRTGGHYTFRFK